MASTAISRAAMCAGNDSVDSDDDHDQEHLWPGRMFCRGPAWRLVERLVRSSTVYCVFVTRCRFADQQSGRCESGALNAK